MKLCADAQRIRTNKACGEESRGKEVLSPYLLRYMDLYLSIYVCTYIYDQGTETGRGPSLRESGQTPRAQGPLKPGRGGGRGKEVSWPYIYRYMDLTLSIYIYTYTHDQGVSGGGAGQTPKG